MKINNPDNLPEHIISKAIQMMQDENPKRTITEITVKPTAEPDEYSITPKFMPVPFERVRRITGYLSTLTNFNNAKQAEEGDSKMNDRDLEHPDITRLERDGEIYTAHETESLHCENCDKEITEEQSAFSLCASCEVKAWEHFRYLLLNEFTQSEREFIDACVEGHSLAEVEKIKPLPAIY